MHQGAGKDKGSHTGAPRALHPVPASASPAVQGVGVYSPKTGSEEYY